MLCKNLLRGVIDFFSTHKLRGDSMNFPFARSEKGMLQGVHYRLQEAKSCVRICCKERTDPKFD
jgi:hypothetical protein